MNIVEKFLQLADKPNVKVIEIRDVGRIGITVISVAKIAQWNDLKNTKARTVFLLKNTVVDPETHALVFDKLSDDDLARFPADISEEIVYHAVRMNGIIRDKEQDDPEKN